MNRVALEHVTKTYRRRPAVQDVTLRFAVGVTAFLGPNGAGKSTLLRLLATAIQPNSGRIEINGADPARPDELNHIRSGLGYLPDSNELQTRLSVLQFLHHVAALKGLAGAERDRSIDERIEDLDFSHAVHHPISQLPTGTVRKLLIAQALLGSPELVILDEPFTDLDLESRHQLANLLRRVGESATVLLAGHHLNDIASMAARLVILNDGSVGFEGSPDQLAAAGKEISEAADLSPFEAGYVSVLSSMRDARTV